jgi:peptidoglycan/LPS O-acetylase OafA/YrhL
MALFLARLRLRGLLMVVAVAFLLLVSLGTSTHVVHDPLVPGHSALDGGPDWSTFGMGFARTLFSFCAGMALGKLPHADLRAQRVWALPCCVLIFALLALPVGGSVRLVYDVVFVCLVSPLIIYGCSRFEPDRRFARVASLIGELSFALYAINHPVADVFHFIDNRTHLPHLVLAPAFLAVCMALAWVAVRWFDIPARRYLGRLIVR